MVEARKQFVTRCVFQDQTTANAAAKRQQIWRAQPLDQARITGQDYTKELGAAPFGDMKTAS